ncbi:thiamine pyrophosphate-dependent enzyme [Testudinibacter sp. TR-2022]|uniref:thiamine pyrophosphate-dependent enzyme n=1 Tax=Testudinibacter sp. TR-2022 TaxID=2585029 RepID=UPI00111B7F89|nr:thiamine pyrophosphate-dependent enzyme [Testudinibacter sp. TR-2022]TNH04422.1 ubiquinone-dependent pyruvate dehydrogenase [Pasteurellaceae bacterium Phil11]TNH22680.1 ubiquinone-dependent pyruvate dehydrogenase [Testudinibacter sp. TR-2022]TNH28943.1 ubiquinone-dependent pyruvate dehydrogenase [Testudinibacter sp. TR-2022]
MGKMVANQLVEMLLQAGVKRVYAITGDSLNPVNAAIRNSGKLEWIHVRHEEVAAYAASMDAELNGIGCCMGSSGPGHVHLINGLYDANRSGNPVIAIASTCPTHKFAQDYFQETNPYYLFQDCSKFVAVANTAEQFPHMMQSAVQAAISQKGVAVLGLPGDVASASAVTIPTAEITYPTNVICRPNERELQQFADLLNQHKKITLYCGHGCRDAIDEVKQLAAVLQSPICYTFRGKIFFDSDDNEFRAGLNGQLGYRSGYDACNQADLLVMLGCDFPYAEFLPTNNKIVQLDIKPERLGRRAKVDLGLAGDVGDTIRALLPLLQAHTDRTFLEAMQKEYQKSESHFADYVQHKGAEDHIQPEYVAHLVSELAADDAVITVDTGMTSVWAARFIKRKQNRYLTGSFNHGSMANAMPMAIGAAVSSQRQVVALCGDGGLSMLLGDLATIMQYNLPIKIILFNNRALGMVKLEMEVSGLVDWQTDMVNPPFDKIAELMNIKGFAAHKTEDVEDAIKQAFAHDGPALVNIYTNSDALSLPPHPSLAQMRDFMTSMTKKLVNGDVGEVIDTAKSNFGHLKELF